MIGSIPNIPRRAQEDSFRSKLEALLNSESMEESSNTPDYILAEYLMTCLKAFDEATVERDRWYSRAGRSIMRRS